tara:strand:+ start:239 stop:439 length:201 start_codon:yes stop_codon:yes gene_type:complete
MDLTQDDKFLLHSIILEDIKSLRRILKNNLQAKEGKEEMHTRIQDRIELLDKIIGKENNVITLQYD